MIRLSPRQRASVDQTMADIRECCDGPLTVAADSEVARLLALEILDDIINHPETAWSALLAWKELLEQ